MRNGGKLEQKKNNPDPAPHHFVFLSRPRWQLRLVGLPLLRQDQILSAHGAD